jgi:hypothetical protein
MEKTLIDWEREIREACQKRRMGASHEDSVVELFRQAFSLTRCPSRAWFGRRPSSVSLVVGGIYLAAIVWSGRDRGLWLLLSDVPPQIEGLSYRPVASSRDEGRPLYWGHAKSLDIIPDLLAEGRLWGLFEAATEQVHARSSCAGDRDQTQKVRGKTRLSEFWTPTPFQLFPDEVALGAPLREGAVYQVTVNAYERSPEARKRCIEAHGARCAACEFDFGLVYGAEFASFIHVHHVRPLSEIGAAYVVDPVKDLRPVCPNCHAVIHYGSKLRSVDDVRGLLRPANGGGER